MKNVFLEIKKKSKKLITPDIKFELDKFESDIIYHIKDKSIKHPSYIDQIFMRLDDSYDIRRNSIYNNFTFYIKKSDWTIGLFSNYTKHIFKQPSGIKSYKTIINYEFKKEVNQEYSFIFNLVNIKNDSFIDIHYVNEKNKKSVINYEPNFRLRYNIKELSIDYLKFHNFHNHNEYKRSMIDDKFFENVVFNYMLSNIDLDINIISEHLLLNFDAGLNEFIVDFISFIKSVYLDISQFNS